MTIEQLEERISQLTDLVNSASDTIENAREMIKLAEQERDRLADQRREQEPKFERVEKGEKYYFVGFERLRGFVVIGDTEDGYSADEALYNNNNYFKTEKRAQEVADKINFLLKLERLHDMFCPDYVPNWNSDEYKYFVFYDNSNRCYRASLFTATEYKTNVFFATKEIAQKVCDILNAELEESYEN